MTGTVASPSSLGEHHDQRWAILAVLCTSLMIVIVGNTALNIALPRLAQDLDASATALQWMVDAYGLVFAGLLFSAGALGDRFGRKGALQAGLVVFLGGSVVASFATGSSQVILGRAIMGIGAAFVMPSTLSILTNVFPSHERAKAIAVWAGISGAGAAIGPVVCGFLLEHFWWGSVFLVNVPIIVVALVAGRLLLPRSRDPEQSRLDIPGAVLSILTVGSLVYGIIEGPNSGWASVATILRFGAAFVFGVLFILWERRVAEPMLDLTLFRNRRFSVASAGMTLTFFAMFGVFFLMTQYFQLVLGFGTLKAGLAQLPFALMIMAVAPQGPRFVARYGPAKVVTTGMSLIAGAQLLMATTTHADSSYLSLLPIFLVMPAGMALTMSPLTASIMSSVPLGRAGVGSAMNDTTRELGGALGVAVLGSLLISRFQANLDPTLASLTGSTQFLARSGLAGALQVAGQTRDPELAQAAKQAFMSGLHLASLTAAGACAVAAVLVYRLLPQAATSHQPVAHAVDPAGA
jgi:EmrB/QacA subfamily drug resistance transporter